MESLADKGYKVRAFSPERDFKNVETSNSIKQVVKGADVIIAPMTGTDTEGDLKKTFGDLRLRLDEDFFNLLNNNVLFLIGIANSKLKEIMEMRDIRYIELARQNDLAILNAIPTAEGAIKIAIKETPFTIHGSKTLILGLGKIGLPLAWRLKVLGSEVYAATRDRTAIARGKDLGFKMVNYENIYQILSEVSLIFNTVPALIVSQEYIKYISRDTVILDLASAPGGIDFPAAEEKGIKAKSCPGLPGKTAPVTAGRILAEVIPDIIREEEQKWN